MIKHLAWIAMIVFGLYAPFIGSADLSISALLAGDAFSSQLFFELRLPRVVFAFEAGIMLSLGGLLFQTLFRNPLMTPYTLGISSGAVFGAGVAILLGAGSIAITAFFGFAGAMCTVVLLIWLAHFLQDSEGNTLLLLGIALSLFFTSALMLLFHLGDAMQNDMLLRFSMGSLSVIGWQMPLLLGVTTLILFGTLWRYRYELQIMALSLDQARLKGIDTKRLRLLLLLVTSLGIGVLVSISGPIGFIGLIVPHMVAKLYRTTLQQRIIPTALFGGAFLLACDTLARSLNTAGELPIGIVTASIGAPFFIYLITHKGVA